MIEGTPFFSVLIDLDPEGTYFFTPVGNLHGHFTTNKGSQLLVVKFSR